MRLFVYGTLRRTAPMHGLLEGRVSRLGLARVAGRLVDLGGFPGLVAPGTPDECVAGELYAIVAAQRESLLAALDRYEGARFRREAAPVEGPEGRVEAWLYRYLGDPSGLPLLPGGDYLASQGPVGRRDSGVGPGSARGR